MGGDIVAWRGRTEPWCIAARKAGFDDAQMADWLAVRLAEALAESARLAAAQPVRFVFDLGHALTVESVSNGRATLRSDDEQGLQAIDAMAAGDVVRVRGARGA